MKRLILIMLAGTFLMPAFAQDSPQAQDAPKAVNFKSLEKKTTKSNVEITVEKKAAKFKTWLKRSELMLKVYEGMTHNANIGMTNIEFESLIGKPKSTQDLDIEGESYLKYEMDRTDFFFYDKALAYWNFNEPLLENPLEEAKQNLEKVLELDVKGKSLKKRTATYLRLKELFIAEASSNYAKKDYAKAYDNFYKSIKIGELDIVNQVDTNIVFYGALSAHLAEMYTEAIELYKKSIELDFLVDGNVYTNLFEAYNATNEGEKGVKYLEKGFVLFPKIQNLLHTLINYYLQNDEDPNIIIEYIDKAIEQEENYSLYFAKGMLLENLGKTEDAITFYQKSIDINPEFFDGVFNLAVVYFNNGVNLLEEAKKVPPREVDRYDELINQSNAEFKNSLPYMEQAYELEPDNIHAIDALRTLYFRFRTESDENMEKYNTLHEKWKALSE